MREDGDRMRQYMKAEAKRFLRTLPGFVLALFTLALSAVLLFMLVRRFLPEALEVKPFRIGLCVEGDDGMSNYVKDYIRQMESTGDLMEFQEIDYREINGEQEFTACIVIPARTAESIMDGTNIPVQVIMNSGADGAERFLQQRLLMLLTECGAVLIDVPQAETLLLYEMQVENPEELGLKLDMFHLGLVLEREDWFEKEEISAFGSADMEEYYLAAGLTFVWIFWGLGCGSFFRRQEKNLPLLLRRRGIPLFFQQGVKQALFFVWYLIPSLALAVGLKSLGAVIPLLLCGMMLSLQCGFFFEAAPTTASGTVLNGIWGIVCFLGAGGGLPSVFLPRSVTGVCGRLPAGICMEILLTNVVDRRGTGAATAGSCLLWCLFFGLSTQFLFQMRQRSRM